MNMATEQDKAKETLEQQLEKEGWIKYDAEKNHRTKMSNAVLLAVSQLMASQKIPFILTYTNPENFMQIYVKKENEYWPNEPEHPPV